jgi:double-strand break repair protein MRE11
MQSESEEVIELDEDDDEEDEAPPKATKKISRAAVLRWVPAIFLFPK